MEGAAPGGPFAFPSPRPRSFSEMKGALERLPRRSPPALSVTGGAPAVLIRLFALPPRLLL